MQIKLKSNELKEMKKLLDQSGLNDSDKNKIHRMIGLLLT